MKLITQSLLLAFALQPLANAHGADARSLPLEKTVQGFAKVSNELSVLAQQNQDRDLQNEIRDLKKGVTDLVRKSVLATINSDNKKLTAFGFDLQTSGSYELNFKYKIVKNPAHASLQREASEFNPENWKRLLPLINQLIENSKATQKLADQPEIGAATQDPELPSPSLMAGYLRQEALEKIAEQATDTLKCINYFPKAYSQSGLLPVSTSNDSYAWSSVSLVEKFKATSINDLSESQKRQVFKDLQKMLEEYSSYGRTCVSPGIAAFMEDERNRLDGK